MNSKAQFDSVHPVAIIFGLVAAFWAFYVAGTMGAGIIMKFLTMIITGVVGFVISNFIFNR